MRRRWSSWASVGLAGVLAGLASLAGLARGQPTESHAKLELIAEDGAGSAGSASVKWVGVLFRLDPGWHVYWQNAGDSGEPPKITWVLPAGLRAGEIRWPTPKRLGSGSVIDYGYEGQVLLMAPIERVPGAPGGASAHQTLEHSIAGDSIAADVRYVVCREICIPGKARLQMAADGDARQTSELFAQTRKTVPRKEPANWRVSATQDKEHFTLMVKTGSADVAGATFFPMNAGVIENSAAQEFAQVAGGFRLRLKKSEQLLKPVGRLRGLIVLGAGTGYEIEAALKVE